ncbi:hypothetical protein ACLMJK_007745 [Lecanora helva]
MAFIATNFLIWIVGIILWQLAIHTSGGLMPQPTHRREGLPIGNTFKVRPSNHRRDLAVIPPAYVQPPIPLRANQPDIPVTQLPTMFAIPPSLNDSGAVPLPNVLSTAPSGQGSTCQPVQCTVNASSVSVYFWPPSTSNTACLASMTEGPAPTLPPGLTPIWPSVYAIIYHFTADNGCSTVGNAFDTFTASFAPGDISTLNPFVTTSWDAQPYDFSDFPCGPPGLDLEGQPYRPQFAPPHALMEQMGGQGLADYADCAFYPFADPFGVLQPMGGMNGPKIERRDDPEPATQAAAAAQAPPQSPVKTPAP